MPTRFSVVVDDEQAHEIEQLAREHDLTDEAALRQLLSIGLETLEETQSAEGKPGRDAAD